MRSIFLSFILIILATLGKGQSPSFRLSINLTDVKDTTVFLAHYYGDKVLKVDSIRIDHQGKGVFTKKEPRAKGIYLIYLNSEKFFDFMLGASQQFELTSGFGPQSEKKFSGSPESELFLAYEKHLSAERTKQQNLQSLYEKHKANGDSAKLINQEMELLNKEMESYWNREVANHKGTFYADFIGMMLIPHPDAAIIPPGCKNSDSVKWVHNYNFMITHYWDHFNFAEPGLLRTPLIESKITNYFKNFVLQFPDSFLRPTFNLIDKAKANEEMYHYISLNRLNSAITSDIMGMDKIFVSIAEKYFLNSKTTWLDSAAFQKLKEKVRVTKPNLIGNKAPELKLPDSEGMYYSLQQVKAPYTILYFWEPSCSHCKVATPLLYKNLYLPFKDKGIEIFAVCTQTKREEWLKAITEYHLFDWTNVWDPANTSNFRSLYDIYSTPVIYILDKEKKIVAKRLDVDTAVKVLERLLK